MKKISLLIVFLFLFIFPTLAQVQYDTLSVKQIGDGMFHYSIEAPAVPWTLEVVEIDLTKNTTTIETAKANDRLASYEKPSSMALRNSYENHEVVAAINGDFYSGGIPINAQIMKGELLKKPHTGREIFGFSSLKSMFIEKTNYQGKLHINGTEHTITSVNSTRNENALVYYNHYMGATTGTNQYGIDVSLKAIDNWVVNGQVKAVVVAKSTAGSAALSDSIFVLSGHGTSKTLLNELVAGDTVIVENNLVPGTEHMLEAMGGSKKFLNNGVIDGNWPERHPRSAIGFNADTTKFYLVTVDGRQSTSAGMTLTELGAFMKGIGAHQALNLDGGGSTAMVVHHEVVNSPSDGSGERTVANALMIVNTKPKIGVLHHLNLTPGFNKVYRNQSFNYAISGSDENYYPIDVTLENTTFTLSEGFDATINDMGLFTAGNSADTGYVYAEFGGIIDTAQVIIKGITEMQLFPKSSVTDSRNTITFYTKANDFDNVFQNVALSDIEWSLDNSAVGEIENGVFTGIVEGQTKVIASYDGVSDTVNVEVQIKTGTQQIDSFDEISGWSLNGKNIDLNTSAIAAVDTVTEGSAALRIDYNFTYNGDPDLWAFIEKDIIVFGIPDTIIVDGKSKGKKHLMDLYFHDDNGEEYTTRLKKWMDNTEYLEYPILLSNLQPTNPFSTFYYPITLKKIGIKLHTNKQQGEHESGSIYLDNLRFIYLSESVVSIEKENQVPDNYALLQNYPNPFNPSTNINFKLDESGFTSLKVYDMLGREVSTLVNENLATGSHVVSFDASNLASGIYMYTLTTKNLSLTKRMTLIK